MNHIISNNLRTAKQTSNDMPSSLTIMRNKNYHILETKLCRTVVTTVNIKQNK